MVGWRVLRSSHLILIQGPRLPGWLQGFPIRTSHVVAPGEKRGWVQLGEDVRISLYKCPQIILSNVSSDACIVNVLLKSNPLLHFGVSHWTFV